MIENILSVIIGLALYNTIIKAITLTALKMILNTDSGKQESEKIKKTLADKMKEEN